MALLDVRMPGLTGLEVCQRVCRDDLAPTTHVVRVAARVRIAGGCGIHPVPAAPRHGVPQPHALPCQPMARTSVHPAELTSREREILVMAADGWSAPYIANMLQLSPGTVNTHLLSSFEKLGVYDRAGAVAAAQQSGLLR